MQVFTKTFQRNALIASCAFLALMSFATCQLLGRRQVVEVQVSESHQHFMVGIVSHRFQFHPVTGRSWDDEWAVRVVRRAPNAEEEVLMDTPWKPYRLVDASWDGEALVVECSDPRAWLNHEITTPDWRLRFRRWGR